MTNSFKDRLLAIGIILLFAGIAAFAYIKTRPIWHGVSIVLDGIQNGQPFDSPLLALNGRAKHATELILNGRPISTDEKGNFSEKILLAPGYSIITIEARDKFKNYSIKSVGVYNTEARKSYLETSPEENADTEANGTESIDTKID